jgi:hypothetical protein
MSFKTHFVYDKETGYILSGFDCCEDDKSDGYNIYTRPYSILEYHPKDEKCRMDFIYHTSIRGGLRNLKYENLTIAEFDGYPNDIKQVFVKNPSYLFCEDSVRGWWKLVDERFVR